MTSLRIVIAEDNLLVRAGIEALLGTEDDVEVVGACSGHDALLACVEQEKPDVVVTDIRMPPTMTDEGIRAATALRATHPGVAVLVLSQFLDPAYLLTLIAQGSSRRGYLLKERLAAPGELVSAVRTVAAGGSFIDPVVVDSLVTAKIRDEARDEGPGRARDEAGALRLLTPRERETLAEVAAGRSNLAIAAAFRVSERAVEKYINSIFSKLGLPAGRDTNRRVKAVLMFLDSGARPG
ncbi:response regulator transcription factor [Actinomadura sp. ATCC 31491]|uniref:Response regulator transcription factor n=1 Tax=Actinomadura luzonensis TaxID=2805427 RepID=A0ABT0FUX9_9ACTN|nr:response regulator transcription factor [Actinomadura luzonensis]MCK2216127.1 response regulator transcription factor [Actinomadura luzonensis]